MAIPKKDPFLEKDTALADLAKALSHPARILILRVLARRDTCICGEIVDQLPLAQSTVSQHLKELKRVGLIQGEVEGPRTCYCVDRIALEKAREAFRALFAALEGNTPSRKGKRDALIG